MGRFPFTASRPLALLPPDGILPNPAQPRRSFDQEALASLAESIRENGILQPLTVRKTDDGYRLIAGERRLRAARMAGLQKVPCVVIKADEQSAAVMALLENLQREDLDCFEEAEGLYNLIHLWGMPREDAAARLGMAGSTLSNKLRLLKLTPWQRERIRAARLTERHARALLRLETEEQRNDMLLKIIAGQWTVAETERAVHQLLQPPQDKPPAPCRKAVVGDLRLCANTIQHAVDAMQRSGVNARAEKTENEQYIQYKILIPKPHAGVQDEPFVQLGIF